MMSISEMIQLAKEKQRHWEALAIKLQEMEVATEATEASIRQVIADHMILAPDETPALIKRLIETIVSMSPQMLKSGKITALIHELVKQASVADAIDRQHPADDAVSDALPPTINEVNKIVVINYTQDDGPKQEDNGAVPASPQKESPSGEVMELVAVDNSITGVTLSSVKADIVSEETQVIADAMPTTDGEDTEKSVDLPNTPKVEGEAVNVQQSLFPLLAPTDADAPAETDKEETTAEICFQIAEWKVEVEDRKPRTPEETQNGYLFFFFKNKRTEGFVESLSQEEIGDRTLKECAQQMLDQKEETSEEVPYQIPQRTTFVINEWKVTADRRKDEDGIFIGIDLGFSHPTLGQFQECLNVEQIAERSPRDCAQQILDDRTNPVKTEELPIPDEDGFVQISKAVRYMVQEDSTIEGYLSFNNRTPDDRVASTKPKNRANKWAESLQTALGFKCRVERSEQKDFLYEIEVTGCSIAQLQKLASQNFSELPPEIPYLRHKYGHLKDDGAIAASEIAE